MAPLADFALFLELQQGQVLEGAQRQEVVEDAFRWCLRLCWLVAEVVVQAGSLFAILELIALSLEVWAALLLF